MSSGKPGALTEGQAENLRSKAGAAHSEQQAWLNACRLHLRLEALQ